MTYPDWLPEVADLGSLMRVRTNGGEFGSTEVGTFDTTTRPTAVQAQQAIEDAADIVIVKVGTVTGVAANIARMAVKLRAAMLVEMSYFAEQAAQANSAYIAYRDEYRDVIKEAEQAAVEMDDGNDPDAGDDVDPVGEFPDGTLYDPESLVW